MSVTKLLNISSRSLQVYQNALTVTSHNIANVNNEKYSRQRVSLTADAPDRIGNITIGSGVSLKDVSRVKNNLLDKQIIAYNKQNSYTSERSQILSTIESLYSEPGPAGMNNLLNDFFDSWDKLAVDPSSIPLRQNVINASNKFNTKLESIYDGYNRIRSDIKSDAKETVNNINNSLEQIYNLNQQIFNATAVGRKASDLLDERDSVINELSKLVNINVSYDEYEVANISIGNSFAVDRKYFNSYKIDERNIDGENRIFMQTADGLVDVPVYGGKMQASIEMFNNVLPTHQSQLDAMANSLMTEVNNLHNAGYTSHNPPLTNVDFFSSYGQGVLRINNQILEDPKFIVASAEAFAGENSVALNISKLKNQKDSGGLTIGDNYSKLISDIANDKLLHSQKSESFQMVINQMNIQKTEYSGVSVDEEMVNMLKYQRSFDASARLIKVADDLLQTIINLV